MPAEDLATCRFCGATGQDEVFCDGCGAVLPVASSSAAEAPAAEAPAAEAPAAEAPAAEAPAADTLVESGPATAEPPAAHDDVLPRSPSTDVRWRARSLIVPVADPAPAGQPEPIAPVLPGVPEPAVPTVRGPETIDVATGPPCPWCSTPNPLDRHFCRRCAMLLTLRPDPAHLPWWRRLFHWFRRFGLRRGELPFAGQRPRLRRGPGRLVRWLGLAAVVGLLAFAADTWAGAAVTDVKDHFAHRYRVFPTAFTASHSDPAHPVADLHDGYNNTWWGTGEAGDGAGTYVDATFDQQINLLDIIITPGAGVEQDAFTAQSRPESVKVTLLRASGTGTTTTITLADSPGPETFAIQGSDVVSVRLTIESAYLAASSSSSEVAIAEVEFFASSGGG
jgi:hypothetical protein